MQETETSKTKVSDSAYSNSSTSQYQRSNGSSKSRHSNSSGSSGYCGRPSVLSSGNDEAFPQPSQTCAKRKEKKRKQLKKVECLSSSSSWDHESGREGIDVVGGRTVTGVTSSITVVNGTSSIGPITGIPGMGAVVSSINTEVTPIMVNSKVTELQNGDETEALQMAALTQTLSCIKKMKGKDSTLKYLQGENVVQRSTTGPLDSRVKEHIANCLNGDTCSTQAEGEGFVVIVSMADGTVVHTTHSLTDTLGFPGDMWLGRDFIDFVHPKDRMAFAGHITSGVARGEDNAFKGLPNKTSFYCSLRQYRGLRNVGYGVTGKRVPYLPFRLTLTFREMNFSMVESQMANSPSSPSSTSAAFQNKQIKESAFKNSGKFNENVFLVITATRIYSAYKVSDEELVQSSTRNSPPPQSPAVAQSQSMQPHPQETTAPLIPQKKFVTRHLSSCRLSHIDPAAIPYLGYLPQDMETRSVMDFYHPEDMPILKEAYHNVMSQQGFPYRGKPYRFRTQNGTYALIETEWSSFVNPWSRKLEFVIGQHCVLKGPSNPDVFAEPIEEECPQFSDEVLKESECIQEEIMFMLDQKVTRVSESARQQVSKRCRDLASFMETIMDEMAKPADLLRVELPAQDVHSISERDSVMLGEISPHHDYYDGKSSTETPPSYNQLNYNENLQRFFESKPKTTLSDESGEMKIEGSSNNRSPNISTDEEGKISPIMMDSSSGSGEGRKFCSQANESESGGSESRARGREGGARGDEDHGDLGGGEGGGEEVAKYKGSRGAVVRNNEVSNKARNTSAHEKSRTSAHGKSKVSSHEKSSASNHKRNDAYHPPHLTEALLSRHNEDMEKIMVQKHREQRSLDREGKLKDGRKSIHDKSQDLLVTHGVKRSGSHSWEGGPQRVKHQHVEFPQQHKTQPGIVGQWEEHLVNLPVATSAMTVTGSSIAPLVTSISSATTKNNKPSQPGMQVPAQSTMPSLSSLNLWPPFSVTLTPMHNSQPCPTYSCPGMGPQKNLNSTIASSATPATTQPPPGTELPPPPQFPMSLQHPLTHPLNPHQGLIPVYYVPTAAMGVMPPSVDAENSSTHPHNVGFPHRQVQQQMPGYSYLMPSPHSQPPGISPVAGSFYIPNHMQYLNTIPPMVYQTVGSAQVTSPASPQMLLQPINSFMPIASPFPSSLSTPNPADAASTPSHLPPHHQSSASNLHYTRLRHSSKNHHAGHMLHHVRLPHAECAGAKCLSRQMRVKDRQGVFFMAGRESLSSTLNDGRNQGEESDGGDEREGSSLLFPKCQRPASQDTSVKAEPGSAVGSIASASGLRDFSEVSKKFKIIGSSSLSKQNIVAEEEESFIVNGKDGMGREGVGLLGDEDKGRHLYAFRSIHDQDTVCDDSSYSSLYSFLRSEKSDESMRSFPWDSKGDTTENDTKDDMKILRSKDSEKGAAEKIAQKPVRKGPSWLEEVDVTPDLIFRYKMDDQILHNVLEADLKALKNIHQSSTVNEQLSQLYMDMELESGTTRLGLEDSAGFTSSSGTDEASLPLSSFNLSPSPTKGKQGGLVHRNKKKRRTMEYGKLVMIFEENAPFPPPLPTYSE